MRLLPRFQDRSSPSCLSVRGLPRRLRNPLSDAESPCCPGTIGLGVFGAIAGLGMLVVGWVTWERKKVSLRERSCALDRLEQIC